MNVPFISETHQRVVTEDGQQANQDAPLTSNDAKRSSSASQCSEDDCLLDDTNNSDLQEARSLSLMKRIGKIKERLSMSSSLNYSHDTKESESLRSKSMPFKMYESNDETTTFSVKATPARSTQSHCFPSPTSNSSNISIETPLDASQSFNSFSTMASDLGNAAVFADHHGTNEQLNISGFSHRSTTTPIPKNAVSPSSSVILETVEQSEHFVDEQRANVVEKLRGAAFKRRMDVSRSRDSLLAKEQRQRAQNQEVVQDPEAGKSCAEVIAQKDQPLEFNKTQFKALPLPKTTGCEGSFGLSGVPAVKKKGITKASSPILGRRRQQTTSSAQPESKKASMLPPVKEVGGLAGIPRVFKKPTTVPRSPMLGRRRAQSVKPASNRRPSLPVMRRKSVESNSSTSSGSLLGLAICTNKENPGPSAIETPTARKSLQVFVPHSTKRAAERRAYEIRRAEHEQAQRENQKRERKVLIKRLERDIEKIRLKL